MSAAIEENAPATFNPAFVRCTVKVSSSKEKSRKFFTEGTGTTYEVARAIAYAEMVKALSEEVFK